MTSPADPAAFIERSPFPWWSWNVTLNRVTASRLKVENLGYDSADFVGVGYEAYTDLLHSDDYNRAMEAMYALLEGRAPIYQVDYRILAADGSYHWYMDRGAIISRDSGGSPEVIRGIVLDLGGHIMEDSPVNELVRLLRLAVPAVPTDEDRIEVCSSCAKIRTSDKWLSVSDELSDFISLPRHHTICESCLNRLYPEIAEEVLEGVKRKT